MGLKITIDVDDLTKLNEQNKKLSQSLFFQKEVSKSLSKELYEYKLTEWQFKSEKEKLSEMVEKQCKYCDNCECCNVLSKYEKDYMGMPYLDEDDILCYKKCEHGYEGLEV